MKVINFLGHTFISDYLNPESIVLDLGGNHGYFSEKISHKFGSKVLVFEPVPELFGEIKENDLVKKYQEAVMPNPGQKVRINLSENRCATAYAETNKFIEAKGVTLEEIIARDKLSSISLLKMDIEGPEVPILETIKPEILVKIDQMTVEFHDFLWPELMPRVEKVKERIANLGYYCIPFSLTNNGDILFIKKSKISFWGYIWLFFTRFWMGFKRRLIRLWS